MRIESTLPVSFEFSTFNPENLVHIENEGERVLIRAAYDNFSPRRKSFLIRQLAAEGYIPDRFEHFTEQAWDPDVVWLVDRSLITIGPAVTRRSGQLMRRLLLGSCVLWLIELVVAFLWAR